MLDEQLLQIQKLQFSDKTAAEEKLLVFLRATEDQNIAKLELTPKPESLNSINGFIVRATGERQFFKTHVEENEKICEYYNAQMLADVGYPVRSAKKIRSRTGTQIAFYEVITLPTLFDLVKEEEDREVVGGDSSLTERGLALLAAQEKLDKTVSKIYRQTAQEIDEREHLKAPIHQLFSHRLQADGRFGLFYRGKKLELNNQTNPANQTISFDSLAQKRWTINGITYASTLSEIIGEAQRLTQPHAVLSIVGHGDAHNGNIFVDLESKDLPFAFFDPAFAGRHAPLLDLTKPLFHNVFARWMYYPDQVDKEIELTYEISKDEISVTHDFVPSLLRQRFLASRIEHVLRPTLELLAERNALDSNWQDYLRATLFCCPFLTVNLCAKPAAKGPLAERYPSQIKILGLCMAVALGSKPQTGIAQNKGSGSKGGKEATLQTLIDSIFAL